MRNTGRNRDSGLALGFQARTIAALSVCVSVLAAPVPVAGAGALKVGQRANPAAKDSCFQCHSVIEVTCLVSERKLRGNVVNHSRNVSFQDLLLLRSAYWTVTVSGSQNFSTHHLKIVNRKQQYHDDAYDFTSGTSHILIEDGFAMTMDDTWAFYGGGSGSGIEDFVVKGFVNYSYTCSLAMGYGGAPPVKHLRLEDAHFVANHNKFAIWIQLTPAYFTGRGYSAGARPSRGAALDDFRFVNCTFENDGGHIYIDGGEAPLTDFVFENCVLDRPYKPDKITGKNVSPILFKNITMNGTVVRNAEDLARAGLDISVPAKFEPYGRYENNLE